MGTKPIEIIFRNSIKTPDGTEIESTHRHDFVCHEDKNGRRYCVDGGHEYLRRVGFSDYTDTSIVSTEDHKFNREHFTWGTYGMDGNNPLKRVILKDMSTQHIINILDGKQARFLGDVYDLFQEEIQYRAEEKTNK